MDVKKCTVCNIKIDGDNCKKDRNICQNCYNINRKKYNDNEKKRNFDDCVNKIEKPKIDNVSNANNNLFSKFENLANVVMDPRNVGKTYYMLKVIEN